MGAVVPRGALEWPEVGRKGCVPGSSCGKACCRPEFGAQVPEVALEMEERYRAVPCRKGMPGSTCGKA